MPNPADLNTAHDLKDEDDNVIDDGNDSDGDKTWTIFTLVFLVSAAAQFPHKKSVSPSLISANSFLL